MENIVIGTAGHVDHGKSTLIKALTGIETDTTTEEKERGMSINIGFAYFDLPGNRRAGIVDVPGHEKFIKNMMAGLAGLNLILLVIDVNEGIMPQTREHIDILQLLGVKDYIVVLSKIGTADEELIELVADDITQQFKSTHLADAPLIKVDAIDGTGIEELKAKIDEKSGVIEQKNTLLPARMHVDRVFTMKGFGTVVTGTLIEGKINVGDELGVYPSGIRAKIRGIQVHSNKAETAFAGQRVALNLSNVSVNEIARGDTLFAANGMQPSWMFDVKVKVLPHAKDGIGLWDRLRIHIGTREVLCRAVPLGVDQISAGEEGFLQLRLEEQAVAIQGDKCILRQYSPMHTIAGAVMLDANPAKHKRFNEELLTGLAIKESGKPEDLILDFLLKSSQLFTTLADITAYMGHTKEECETWIQALLQANQIVQTQTAYLHAGKYDHLKQETINYLDRYHKDYRLRPGMPKEELRSKFPQIAKGKAFDLLLAKFEADNVIKTGDFISLADFEIKYNPHQLKDKATIEQQLKASRFTPLAIESLTHGKQELRELIESLNGHSLIRLDDDTVMDQAHYEQAVVKVKDFIKTNNSMTLADFRDMLSSSRKFSMIILEYMDKEKITRRVDNTRVLY
ncbi:MAG: selenocysteine-specific translation elongation factor [Turicibacter sp.]|nr:selenocysteine-specific translation elongation factor [Turicibacter sp.]